MDVSWNPPDSRQMIVHVDASVSGSGISYMLTTCGPSGGPGMGGHQSLETFLEKGGLYEMPPEITARIRAFAEELLATARAHITWTIDAAAGSIHYVSSDINEVSVKIVQFENAQPTKLTLYEGTVVPGTKHFAVYAQWQSATDGSIRRGTFRQDFDLAAGTRSAVCTQLGDGDVVTSLSSLP